MKNFISPINDKHLPNYKAGKYIKEVEFYKKILVNCKNPVFFDVGANIGYFSHELADYCSEVHSFEPVSDIFECLKENTSGKKNVKISKLGISNVIDKKEILVSSQHCQGSSLDERIHKKFDYIFKNNKEIINLTTLKNYIEENNVEKVDLIKLDIEGLEVKAITGLGDKIKIVKNIIFETYFNEDLNFLSSFCKKNNLKIFRTSLSQPMYWIVNEKI